MKLIYFDDEEKLQEAIIDNFTADEYEGEEIMVGIRAEANPDKDLCGQWLTINVCGAETYNMLVAIVKSLKKLYTKISFHMEDKS
jgi:hypothetical protein